MSGKLCSQQRRMCYTDTIIVYGVECRTPSGAKNFSGGGAATDRAASGSKQRADTGGGKMSGAVYQLTPEEQQILEDLPSAVGVYQCVGGQIVPLFFSKRFLGLFGYDTQEQAIEAQRKDLYRYVHPDDTARISECAYRFMGDEAEYDVVYRDRNRKQADYRIIHATGRHVWKNGMKLACILYSDESRILRREQDEGLHLSETLFQKISLENDLHRNQFDDLTGLPMIGRFLQNMPEKIREMRRENKVPAILWLDYSGLRDYDALHGFETGDVLIRGLAWLIRDEFGVRNTARFNSDYFVACAESEHLEESIHYVFEEAAKLNRGNSRPVAVGIYVMNQGEIGLSAAIDCAKLACDSLKEPPHSAFAYFDQDMLDRAELRQYLIENFPKAMENGWIRVYYQPVVRTVTGKLCGAEALCRWKDPVYGMISPGEFIPALEEEGRITELDLYMIEQVCRDGRKILDSGRNLVPVSVNLSRKDFRQPDLVDRIEALAKQYEIPRELLNIEITESAFIRHPERLSKYISRFHELGFQVWMDDFGTAYSSLGALKDLKFDELKIDMSFLSTSTDKARDILTSVVDMAKTIGIQTLAEGVETAEQYEFLKKIGCEKVQGYYFGKPMDGPSFRQHCRDRQIEEEQLRWKNYYDALSRIDYQTDEPLLVVEDDGVTLRQLFVNDAYRAVLRRDNIDDIGDWFAELNADNNPAHAFHRQYADEQLRKLPGPQVITYPSGDHYMELTGTVVTHYEQYYIYAMNIRYIQMNAMSEDQKRALYVQNIFYLCSDIAVFNLEENRMYGLKSVDSSQPIRSGGKTVDLMEAVQVYTEKFIYPPDQKRYMAFFDLKTLKARMQEKKGQDLTGFFRSRMPDSEYHWMLHMIMPMPNSGFNQYLVITLPVDFDSEFRSFLLGEMDAGFRACGDRAADMSARAYGSQTADTVSRFNSGQGEENEEITPSVLWKNLEAYSDGMYFWKDRNRRFVGASRSFLEFYGFRSEEEIIGKTDEDMHWHVETEPFKNDEIEVLKNGKNVSYAKGKCIARGKQRTILANKIPVFRDGRIVGLMGSFFDAENLFHLLNDRYQSTSVDAATDLLNTRGISDSLRDYLGALWTENTEFSMIQVYIPEYEAFDVRYGEDAGKTLLRGIGEILREIFGKESSIGRLTGSYFVILIQEVAPEHVQAVTERIQDEVSRLRRVGEWQCAVTAEIRTAVMNQTNASREKYAENLNRMWMGFGADHPEV